MSIRFAGGASAIGASCALVQVGDTSVIIDAGVRFESARPLPDLDAFNGLSPSAIFLTHAHSDHSGALPVVSQSFPSAPIYMTPPTLDLVRILQYDALKLQHSADRELDIPLFSEVQVERMLDQVHPIHHGASVTINDIRATWLPASHILGASMIYIETPDANILFTGDYCVTSQHTVPGLLRPSVPVDVLITESTYGNRMHSDRTVAEARLIQHIGQTLDKGGKVLIPAFAIGRAQEIIFLLRDARRKGRIPKVPIFVDGMVRSVCGVYSQHDRYIAQPLHREIRQFGHPFFSDGALPVRDANERRDVLTAGPCVIVSSSGMLQGGPAAFYAAELAPDERNAILITGYQDEESPGRFLLNLASEKGPRLATFSNRQVDVKCSFDTYSLSAHADRLQMAGLVEALKPTSVFLVHGDTPAKEALASSVTNCKVTLAEDGSSHSIEKRTRRPKITTKPVLNEKNARSLVGPDRGEPISLDALVLAWFGHPTKGKERDAFVKALFDSQVVRTDNERPNYVRSLIAPPTVPLSISAEQLEQLVKDNPKGKLNSLCQRRRIQSPWLTLKSEKANSYIAEMSIEWAGELLRSGPQQGPTEKIAEQLAAQVLLNKLPSSHSANQRVSDSEAAQRKAKNPKGKLLELCSKNKWPMPEFSVEADSDGFTGTASLSFSAYNITSGPWSASKAKDVEQALADEILQRLTESPQLPATDLPTAPAGQPHSPHSPPQQDPRGVLNHYMQLGYFDAFGYEEVDRLGPTHLPVFVMRGWYEQDGDKHFTEATQAPNKKKAEAQCAMLLLKMLEPVP